MSTRRHLTCSSVMLYGDYLKLPDPQREAHNFALDSVARTAPTLYTKKGWRKGFYQTKWIKAQCPGKSG